MKLRTKSRLKGILIPAIAALFLGAGAIACSSSGEENAPDAAMAEDGAVSNSDPLANDANAAAEGEAGAENKAANGGNEELSNLVNDGSANAASAENPASDPALSNNAGADPFANPAAASDADKAAGAANTSGAALNSGADPFAPADGAAAPANATVGAESSPTTNPAADAGAVAAGEETGEPAAVDTGAPVNPAAAPANNAAAAATTEAPAAAAEAPAAAPAASSGPTAGYVPENGSKMAYYVQRGDTLGSISQKIFGKKTKWRELASANNLSDPNRIYAGDVILYSVDDSSRGFADKYETAPRQSVTVATGDTLSSISAKVYGSEGSWRTLWKENPSVKNPDVLTVGKVLFYRSAAQSAQSAPLSSEEGVAATEKE